ncbi:lycopene cyclase family protein [Nocardia sp. NPDC048505]|uniref:lycopene cyclase family protein n=1 Tax=unclassified Nocardia TaxID=2637762 RepID=UPI003401ECD2
MQPSDGRRTAHADLVVCGAGPAGRALAHRGLARGLAVTVIDPAPERRWTATYAAWADELPGWLDETVVATRVERPIAWGTRSHDIDRAYVVLDTPGLQRSLDITGAQVISDRARDIGERSVTLASGEVRTGERVIDARGLARDPARAEQTAYGVIVAGAPADTLFMDWRPDNGADPAAPPSFLYSVPLGGGSHLLEETCLVGRPALDSAELRTRLLHRLRSRGIDLGGDEPVERVRFPVEGGRPGRTTFGAAGGFLHPATGYSVAATLTAADTVAAGESAWPWPARAVHTCRSIGLRALLALPPNDIPRFFDAFFTLPPHHQRAYLSGRTDLRGTTAAMLALFTALPMRRRRTLAAAVLPSRR